MTNDNPLPDRDEIARAHFGVTLLNTVLLDLYKAGRLSVEALDEMRVALYQLRADLQSRGIAVPLEDE